ncbi:MAG: PKD domain-containing protein [Planctomycetes bacterium]|nr:PKD domain-containing protein [Planctomycetota bacterium]
MLPACHRLLLSLPVLLLRSGGASSADWALEGYRCRRELEVRGEPAGEGEIARVRFLTLGYARPDGSDVRAVGPDGILPSSVLSMRHDLCRLAVGLRPGLRRFWVYYGHPGPGEPPAPALDAWRGLWLETRRYNGGECRNWAEMEETIRKSGPSLGRDVAPQVFHGYNPFGPSDHYVSLYEGWLSVPRSGEYVFATTSDDASFLFVGGRLEVSKTGWGPAPHHARHVSGPVKLEQGRSYPFRYCHVEGTGEQAAVAAWKPPDEEFQLIPATAFPGVRECAPIHHDLRDWPIAPDFIVVNEGEAPLQGKTYFRHAFRDTTPGDTLSYEPFWDFGDGGTSKDRNPVHIYLEPGLYTASFSLSRAGQSYRVALRVEANWDWENPFRPSSDEVSDYYPFLKKYDFPRLSTPALENALEIFRFLRKPDELLAVSHALLLRDEVAADEARLFATALEYGRQLRDRQKAYGKAVEAFLFADERVRDPARKARLRLEIGDVFFFFEEDYERARAAYLGLLKDFAELKDSVLRQAQIRLGEIDMRYGDASKALAAFQAAEKMPSPKRAFDQDLAVLGGLPLRVEDYLRRGELDAAEEELDRWEWEYPIERLAGCSTLWRVRLAQARGQQEEAIKLARILVHASPRSAYAAELLLEAAKSYGARGDLDSARKMFERILQDYPETPLQGEVRARLDALKAPKETPGK